ncbi:MAG: NUDIX hydrolase [Thermoanaerobaculia bacterium]
MTKEIDKLALLHIHNKRLLSARSRGKDAFYLPGGKREPGESDQDALIREIKEELAVDVIPETIEYVGTFKAQADAKAAGTIVKMTCYRADFRGEVTASAEIDEVIWIGYKDIAKCSPVTKIIVEWLHKQGTID